MFRRATSKVCKLTRGFADAAASNNNAMIGGAAVAVVGGGVLYMNMGGATAYCMDSTKSANYPPKGLSEGVQTLPEWIQLGCGDKEYYCEEKGATFPVDFAPDKCPDLSKHNNIMAEVLKANPGLYEKLKDRKTKNGVTFAKCIKTGMDNPGHPMIKTVGMVLGDEESYETFKELFDPVIAGRHNGYPAHGVQPTNLDIDKLSNTKIDPTATVPYEYGKYVLTTRVRTGRSVRGFKLPPSCSFEERRKLESIVVGALKTLQGDLAGDYFPLHGSRSYAAKPNGMTHEKEEELRNAGNLFQEPDSTLLLSSGMGRHWPDARGIYHNNAKNFFVWLNEEDHMRIVSMQKGDDVKEVTARFMRACDGVQKVLKAQGYDFMHSDHLGYILTCPSNLGTGLRAGSMMLIPKLSAHPKFKSVVKAMGLQARGGRGVDSAAVGGKFDISNADRIGRGEVDLVNIMINGCSKFVRWEMALEKGENIESQLQYEIDNPLPKLY